MKPKAFSDRDTRLWRLLGHSERSEVQNEDFGRVKPGAFRTPEGRLPDRRQTSKSASAPLTHPVLEAAGWSVSRGWRALAKVGGV